MKKLLLLLLVLAAGLAALGWPYDIPMLAAVERTPPEASIAAAPSGSARTGRDVTLQLADEGAGLRSVRVVASQGAKQAAVFEREFEPGTTKERLAFTFSPRESGFEEGELTLTVTARDRSPFGNESTSSLPMLVDYYPPKIEVLTLQHVAHQGGAEFVVMRVSDSNLLRSGVRVGEEVFPALPAERVDPQLAGEPDLAAVLFALPLGFEGRVEAFAEDRGGNRTAVPLSFRIAPFKQAEPQSKLSDDFLRTKMPELFPKYQVLSKTNEALDLDTEAGLAAAFERVNEEYRTLLDEALRKIFEGELRERLWSGPFMKPMGSATSSLFGEKRNYVLNGRNVSSSLHNGVDLASVRNDSVKAAGTGIVVFAADHGIYGNTVVLDHGMGLFTLYGHLSSILVNEGERVERGAEIGRTGTTGLAGGDHLHFEFRVRNVPVTPIEWWDAKWITDNIDGKTEELRRADDNAA